MISSEFMALGILFSLISFSSSGIDGNIPFEYMVVALMMSIEFSAVICKYRCVPVKLKCPTYTEMDAAGS
jgi:hypothetical protein